MFFERIGNRNWVFFQTKGSSKLTLFDIANVTIRRHIIGLDLNPYDLKNKLYFPLPGNGKNVVKKALYLMGYGINVVYNF